MKLGASTLRLILAMLLCPAAAVGQGAQPPGSPAAQSPSAPAASTSKDFPKGTATPSAEYNDRSFKGDQRDISSFRLPLVIGVKR